MIKTSLWAWNGGYKTWAYLMSLPKVRRNDILNWISRWPLYYDIEVNGRRFLLTHAGFAMNGIHMSDDFYQKGIKRWEEIDGIEEPQFSQSMLWIRENWILSRKDLPCDVVFGHTPSAGVYNMVTDLGKVMDAIADKILVNGVLVVLAVDGFIPSVITSVI